MEELRDRVRRIVRQVVMEMVARGEQPAQGFVPGRRPLVVANWKMHMNSDKTRDFARRLEVPPGGVEVVVCPPSVLLPVLRDALGPATPVRLGAQDLHPAAEGAHTGEHAGPMLRDAGARYVLVGHSERRLAGEDDQLVRAKLAAAHTAGLVPLLCVGEGEAERRAGATMRVLRGQLTAVLGGQGAGLDPDALVIAYEPVWAIGTGHTAGGAEAQDAMGFLRERLAELFSWGFARRVRFVYGGSAGPENAGELASMPDIDGLLVGGASLDPGKFGGMAAAVAGAKAVRGAREES